MEPILFAYCPKWESVFTDDGNGMYDLREDGKAVIEKDKNGPELRVGRDAFRFCLLWFVACVDYQLVW